MLGPHLQIAASCPYFGYCEERFSSPGGLSHSSPCHPAAKVHPQSAIDQDGGRLQAAPHKVGVEGSARTAAGLDEGVERKSREDARVSRHCLRAPLANSCRWQRVKLPNVSFSRKLLPIFADPKSLTNKLGPSSECLLTCLWKLSQLGFSISHCTAWEM